MNEIPSSLLFFEMTYENIIGDLRALEVKDFAYDGSDVNGPERLEQLTDALLELPERQRAVPELFGVMERLAEADLGSPGPLVHTLGQLDHVEELIASVQRLPTVLSVCMLNRLLNTNPPPDRRELFLKLLTEAATRTDATYGTREDAKHFIQLQKRVRA